MFSLERGGETWQLFDEKRVLAKIFKIASREAAVFFKKI